MPIIEVPPTANPTVHGTVDRITDPLKHWGFITAGDQRNIFYHFKNVIPDCIGRRHLSEGDVVSFQLNVDGRHRTFATNVKNISPELENINILEHREWSNIVSLDPIWLKRAEGDDCILYDRDIFNFQSAQSQLVVGAWIYHGIRKRYVKGIERWYATCAQVADIGNHEINLADGAADEAATAWALETASVRPQR